MKTEYWVPKSRVEGFKLEAERLNRRAKRFGLPLLTVEVTEEEERVEIGEGPVTLESFPNKTKLYGTLVKVLVGGELPKLNGWEFVARIDHDAGGNLLFTHPGAPEVPDEYWKVGTTCDHCETKRRRNDTYLLHHENGEWKHVGSSCLKDFLGHKLSGGWFSVYGDLADLDETFKEYLGSGGCEPEYDLRTVLAYTSAYCKEYGWTSRTKARETDGCATADGVYQEVSGPKESSRDEHLNPDKSDFEEAEAALDWAKGVETNGSNYLKNIKVLAERGFLTYKGFGLGCSIRAAWKRDTEVAREKAEERESNYVGEVKKREEFTLTLVSLTEIEGYYGVTLLHNFMDPDGNRVKWFASTRLGLEEGETVEVKATVKSHEEYKGRKETLVNRVKLVGGPRKTAYELLVEANEKLDEEEGGKS